MVGFALGFLCCAAIFMYINARTRANDSVSVGLFPAPKLKPDNKKARFYASPEFREATWREIESVRHKQSIP